MAKKLFISSGEESGDVVTADPTTDGPAAWLTIKLDGTTYYFAGYTVDGA